MIIIKNKMRIKFVLIAVGLLGLFERAIGFDFNRTVDNATETVSSNDNNTNYELPGQCPSFQAAPNFNDQKVFGGKAVYRTVYQTMNENTEFNPCRIMTYSLMSNGSVWFKHTTKYNAYAYGDGFTFTGQLVPVLGVKGQYNFNFTQTPIIEGISYSDEAANWAFTVASIDETNNNYVAIIVCANDTADATHDVFITIKARNGILSDQELKDIFRDLGKAGLSQKSAEKNLRKISIDCD